MLYAHRWDQARTVRDCLSYDNEKLLIPSSCHLISHTVRTDPRQGGLYSYSLGHWISLVNSLCVFLSTHHMLRWMFHHSICKPIYTLHTCINTMFQQQNGVSVCSLYCLRVFQLIHLNVYQMAWGSHSVICMFVSSLIHLCLYLLRSVCSSDSVVCVCVIVPVWVVCVQHQQMGQQQATWLAVSTVEGR